MKASYSTLLAGILALVFCGTAIAHDSGYYSAPATTNGYGSIVIWSNGQGALGWSANLGLGVPLGYAQGYVAWAPHQHLAGCRHPSHFALPPHANPRAYRKGYREGRLGSHGRGRGHGHHH